MYKYSDGGRRCDVNTLILGVVIVFQSTYGDGDYSVALYLRCKLYCLDTFIRWLLCQYPYGCCDDSVPIH